MIKVICFDLDGVYFTDKGKKGFHKSLVDITGDEDKVVQALYKSSEMLSFVTGKMTEADFWNYMRTYLGLALNDEEFCNLWTKDYEIDDEVRSVVIKLRKSGYLTAICSNNNPARIKALEAKFGFLSDFDIRIFSYEVGFVKPNKEIFEALIRESNVLASEIIYSDDNAERIKGAAELGINTFVYQNFPQFSAELRSFGVNLD
jgi:HAD superfamily hydrolase (TIGR01509 family)